MPSTKVFCVAPFVHMYYRNSGDYYTFKPCCEVRSEHFYWIDKSKNNKKENVIDEYWNSDYIKDIRKAMLENKPHDACKTCYSIEKTTGYSHREIYFNYLNKNYNDDVKFNIDTGNEFNNPLTLDYRPSNLCNLKCRMCGPQSSSEWAKEIKNNISSKYKDLEKMSDGKPVHMMTGDSSFNYERELNFDDQYKNLPLENIRRANFLGGEPLLNEEIFEIMSYWAQIGKSDSIRIQITTNGTGFQKRWLDLFSKFKRLKVIVSADGIEEIFDYIRTNANWEKVKENIQLLLQIKNINVSFSYTVQMYNAFHFISILNFLKQWKEEYQLKESPVFENVHQDFLSTGLLDQNDYDEIKNELLKYKIDNIIMAEEVDELLSRIQFDRYRDILETERKYFIDYTNKLDEVRNTSLIKLNPKFKKYLI
jgi:MoaA/NifB/PqqE/SkfB family radical SAM enzyme